jgi:hypothetical protein
MVIASGASPSLGPTAKRRPECGPYLALPFASWFNLVLSADVHSLSTLTSALFPDPISALNPWTSLCVAGISGGQNLTPGTEIIIRNSLGEFEHGSVKNWGWPDKRFNRPHILEVFAGFSTDDESGQSPLTKESRDV